jgi:RimJ/RimL family protein N-acetyltransferase
MDVDGKIGMTIGVNMAPPSEIICETNRLWLVPFTAEYVEELIPMFDDAEACRFIGGVRAPEEIRPRLLRYIEHYRLHGFSRWAVIHKQTGAMMGWCGPIIFVVEGVTEVELGYTLRRPWWGNGYATEAAKAALTHAQHTLGLRRIISLIDPQNARSLRVAAKLGLQKERLMEWNGAPAHIFRAPDLAKPTKST